MERREKTLADHRNSVYSEKNMGFFGSAITILQTLVVAIGAGLGVWGVINLMEGYGMIIRVLNHRELSSL